MKINQVNKILQDKHMQNKECNFKIIGGGRTSTRDLILSVKEEILIEINKLGSRIDKLEKRIDNLVVKNNLNE